MRFGTNHSWDHIRYVINVLIFVILKSLNLQFSLALICLVYLILGSSESAI